ncbi:MAG: MFS transporter [Armatimonadetes bacterium]|nr:MFS transporter [Armatimonadota bacterium]MDE2207515.1 MFS transporter [Armatimonadota bacterium]
MTDNAPHELSRFETLRAMRFSVWESGLSNAWGTLVSGAFLTGFGLWLGAGSVEIGLLTAIPAFAGLVQLLASWFARDVSARRPFTAWYTAAGRALWLPILIFPLVLPAPAALILFLALFTASNILVNVPQAAFVAWLSDLVPSDFRGRFFGRRNMVASLAAMAVSLPAALWLDRCQRHGHTIMGFGTVFGVSLVAAAAAFAVTMRQPEPPPTPPDNESRPSNPWSYLLQPLEDRNFRRFVVFSTMFAVGQFIAAPFFNVYALQVLHLSYFALQVYAAIVSGATLLALPLWGYLSDKFGNRPLLVIAALGVVTLPVSWAATQPGHALLNATLLTELNIGSGIFWAGIALVQFNLVIAIAPAGKMPVYAALMAAATGVAGGVAPMLGGALMQALAHWHAQFAGLHITRYHIIFLLASALRLATIPLLKGVEDPGAASTRSVIRQIGAVRPGKWRHIRNLQRPGGEATRLRAAEALGESATRLASNEMAAGLQDPSPAVRKAAAQALDQIGGPQAVRALSGALSDAAPEVRAIAVHTLSEGETAANWEPELVAALDDWAVAVRLAAARSLARRSLPRAADALERAMDRALAAGIDGSDVAAACLAALARCAPDRAESRANALIEDHRSPDWLRAAAINALAVVASPLARATVLGIADTAQSSTHVLIALAAALEPLAAPEAVPQLAVQLEGVQSAVDRAQIAVSLGAALHDRETLYSALAQLSMGREAAIARLFDQLQRRAPSTQSRQAVRLARRAWEEADLGRALHALARALEKAAAGDAGSEAARSAVVVMAQSAHRTKTVTQEGFILSLAAALRALDGAQQSL